MTLKLIIACIIKLVYTVTNKGNKNILRNLTFFTILTRFLQTKITTSAHNFDGTFTNNSVSIQDVDAPRSRVKYHNMPTAIILAQHTASNLLGVVYVSYYH